MQQYLVPHVEYSPGRPSSKEGEFVRAAELAGVDAFIGAHRWAGNGRRPHRRKSIALASIARAVWDLRTTRALVGLLRASRTLRTLCGRERAGDVPSEATFSRAFAAFAEEHLPERIHGTIVESAMAGRPVGHAGMDSAEIPARERAERKARKARKARRGPGERRRPGPKKGSRRGERKPKKPEVQARRTPGGNLAGLPRRCDAGAKRDSGGHMHAWKGYRPHLSVADGGAPLCGVLASASLHDSRAAIPLVQMCGGRAGGLHGLADAAYGAAAIAGFSRSMGHVPIVAPNGRHGAPPLEPAHRARLRERTAAERAFSSLKDGYGGRSVRVRGAAKVMAHLMGGGIALTAAALFRVTG
jgi:hypothetical protein